MEEVSLEIKAAELVKWLVGVKKVKRQNAYYIAKHKFGLENINGLRKEYQKIKSNQLKLI